MKSFDENFLVGNIDARRKKQRWEEIVEKAHKKALKILQIDQIDQEDFKDLYGEKQVSADREYVRKAEGNFEIQNTPEQKEAKKLADIFEAIIHEQIEINEWLGENVHTIKPASYDDIKNGVDEIIEFQQKKERMASHLALAIDITFSDNLHEKIDRIKQEIRDGHLSIIKYFKSDFISIRGEKSDIPRVVVGIDKDSLKEIIRLWLENKNKQLYNHPLKNIILKEILLQLDFYREYAEEVGQSKIASKMKSVYNIINNIVEKNGSDISESGLENDRVYNAIKNYLLE